jgi:2-phosphoglycerate kinase
MSQIFVSPSRKYPDETEIEELLERKKAKIQRKVSDVVCHFVYNRNAKGTTLCVLLVGVAMGAGGSGIHEIYFPGARGLGIHEILSS